MNINKLIFLKIVSIYYLLSININTYAADKGILDGISGSKKDIRTGDLHIEDISGAIKGMIDISLGIAGMVAVLFVIVGAYKLLFGSLKGDATQGKETIIMAITGFAVAALAWFIVKFIFNNFS